MRRSGLALGLLVATAWIGVMLVRCDAAQRTLYVNGHFTQQGNGAHFGLALPIPFDLFVSYDDEGFEYWEFVFDDSLGVYRFPNHYGGLSFGTGIGFHWIPFTGTEVRIWNNHGSIPAAISFGNAEPLSAYGLAIDSYRIYALFPNPFFAKPAGWDDRLHWAADVAGDYRFEVLSYVFLFGHTETPAWTETWLQTGAAQSYNVE